MRKKREEAFDIESLPSVWDIPDPAPRPPRPPEPAVAPTFDQLCELDRDLWRLAIDARDEWSFAERRPFFCREVWWYRYFKPRLVLIVGYGSRHPDPLMRTEAAYSVAYHGVHELLRHF